MVMLLSFFLLCQAALYLGLVRAEANETTIKQQILKGYDRSMAPVLFTKGEHATFTAIVVLRIRGLDEARGEFILEGITHIAWTDERLLWESDNIKGIRVRSDQIWLPHLRVLNRVSKDEITLDPLPVVFKGGVWWAPRHIYRTACIPNLKYFPFDTHTCDIKIVSVTEEGDFLQTNYSAPSLRHATMVRTSYLIENKSWKLMSADTKKTRMEVEDGIMGDVGVFTFEIKRSMPLIALAILTPSLVSVILLLTTFWMKEGTVIRTGINATSLLVSTGNLFTISRVLPVNGAVTPIIVEYVTSALVLSLISTAQTVAMSLLPRCRKPPPFSYSMLLEKFPKWMLAILALLPPTPESTSTDETFLFSELSETDQKIISHNENNKTENTVKTFKLQHPWEKHILLLDRLAFYLFGVVILLLILSVLITE